MRELTREEVEEYFQFASTSKPTPEFCAAQVQIIGEALLDHPSFFKTVDAKLRKAMADHMDPMVVFLSIWVTAFQMGRECESRLLTAALKGGSRGL